MRIHREKHIENRDEDTNMKETKIAPLDNEVEMKLQIPEPHLSDNEKEQIKGRLDKIIRMVSETDLSRFDYLIYDGLQQSHSDLKELSQFLHERAKTRHDHAMKEAALVAYKKIKKFGFDEDERITINGTEYAVTDDKVTAFEAPPF